MYQPIPFCEDAFRRHNGDRKAYMHEVISAGVNPTTAQVQFDRWKKNLDTEQNAMRRHFYM